MFLLRNVAAVFVFAFVSSAQAADLPALKRLFETNYNTLYQQRLCGLNVQNFLKAAQAEGIDLSNSYVVRWEGAGFLETSGFYTRSAPNDRAMLGYFHYVLVADEHVIDFDLAEPLVPSLQDYVRLQFTPPTTPFQVFGKEYQAEEELRYWTAIRYRVEAYVASDRPAPLEKLKVGAWLNLPEIMGRARLR